MEARNLPARTAGTWPTKVQVQCRYEPVFEAKIRFHPIPKRGLVPYIDCPNCGRRYFLNEEGEWFSDRPLTIIDIVP